MNIRKIIAVALAAAFAVTAGAQEKKIKIVRKAELKKENALLRTELDSHKAEREK